MTNLVAPVGILGFGIEGKSTLRYLLREGIKDIIVMDKNPVDLPEIPAGVKVNVVTGEKYLDGLLDCVTVVRSAGVFPMLPEIFQFQKNGGILTSQISLYLERTRAKTVVGVTGTLGKGSCVSLIRHALEFCKQPCIIGGNFGVPALDLLESDSPERVSILELSSFQLMTLAQSPHIAVVLRVSSEHLDWHRSVEEYRDAKANLVRWQKCHDFCIYLKDALPSHEIALQSGATRWCFGHGDNVDVAVDDVGLTAGGLHLSLVDCKVRGIYQLENMAAAFLACKALGADLRQVLEAFKSYETLPFRMEFKGEFGGIEFYNDSYATRPDATIAAVKSMKRPFALILGGSEKNADFTELATVLAETENLQKISLIGDTAVRMKMALQEAHFTKPMQIFPDMDKAFADCLSVGKGGTVMLSPACASFGLFKNYKVRGEAFDHLVKTFAATVSAK